jgi:hypothetical protein
MACTVEVIEHSVSPEPYAPPVVTVACRYWRAIHAELMTHRVFSRNASSSRAIPVKTMLKQVWNEPAGPIHWGANQAGMQANKQLTGFKLAMAKTLWKLAGRVACVLAWGMMKVGLHKQVANRILEPWQYITVLITSTEWSNFMELRNHPDAQPEIRELAQAIEKAVRASTPQRLRPGQWHLPFVRAKERKLFLPTTLVKVSTARNARVSYLTHAKEDPSVTQDCQLHDKLVMSRPMHASPSEHPCKPDRWIDGQGWENPHLHGNLKGYIQYRKILEIGGRV